MKLAAVRHFRTVADLVLVQGREHHRSQVRGKAGDGGGHVYHATLRRRPQDVSADGFLKWTSVFLLVLLFGRVACMIACASYEESDYKYKVLYTHYDI